MAVAGSQSAAADADRASCNDAGRCPHAHPRGAAAADGRGFRVFVLLLIVAVAIFGPAARPLRSECDQPRRLARIAHLAPRAGHGLARPRQLLALALRHAHRARGRAAVGDRRLPRGRRAGPVRQATWAAGPTVLLVVVFDAVVSFPAVILGLALLTLLGPSIPSVVLVIGIALVPYYGRLVRGQTLSERRNQYVKAERSLGASRGRVLLRHILPNVLPPMLIIVAMDIPGAISIEAGLAFLGLGVQPPTADWGVMLNGGFTDIGTSPWEILGPIAALILITSRSRCSARHSGMRSTRSTRCAGADCASACARARPHERGHHSCASAISASTTRSVQTPRCARSPMWISSSAKERFSASSASRAAESRPSAWRSCACCQGMPPWRVARSRSRGAISLQLGAAEMRAVRGRDVAVIFQDPSTSLNPTLSIGAQLLQVQRAHAGADGRGRAALEKRALDKLDEVGIPDARQALARHPHEFSGGMRQRVMIAMALLLEPAPDHRRRGDLGARRHARGADPRAAAASARRPRHGDAVHLTRPGRRLARLRSRRRHVRRARRRRDRRGECAPQSAAPVHPGAPGGSAGSALTGAATRVHPWPGAETSSVSAVHSPIAAATHTSRCLAAEPPLYPTADGATRCYLYDPSLGAGAEVRIPRAEDWRVPDAPLVAVPASLPSAEAGSGPMLDVRDLRVEFGRRRRFGRSRNAVAAVAGVDLTLERGQILGVVGESGSGKTTLGEALVNLVTPTAGSCSSRASRRDGDEPASSRTAPSPGSDDLPEPVRQPLAADADRARRDRAVRDSRHREQ